MASRYREGRPTPPPRHLATSPRSTASGASPQHACVALGGAGGRPATTQPRQLRTAGRTGWKAPHNGLVPYRAVDGLWVELAGVKVERVDPRRRTIRVDERLVEVNGQQSWGAEGEGGGDFSRSLDASVRVEVLEDGPGAARRRCAAPHDGGAAALRGGAAGGGPGAAPGLCGAGSALPRRTVHRGARAGRGRHPGDVERGDEATAPRDRLASCGGWAPCCSIGC